MKRILFITLFALLGISSYATNRLYVEPFSIAQGETKTIDFLLENDISLYAFQANIVFPSGLEIVSNGGVPECKLGTRTDASYSLSTNFVSNNAINVGSYSLTPISGNSGTLFSITVKASNGFEGGTMTISNIIFTNAEGQDVNFNDFSLNVKKFVPVTGITLDKTSVVGYVGETAQLYADVGPHNATNPAVVWSSENTAVATVSENGLVSLLSAGTATITATAVDGSGVSASCVVTVNQYAQSISLNYTSINDIIGKAYQLTATVLPENATNKAVVWSSSAPTVASVSEAGLITLNSAGTATITATVNDGSGVKATCEVTVSKLPQTISWNQEFGQIYNGDIIELTATASSGLPVDYRCDGGDYLEIVRDANGKAFTHSLSAGTYKITAYQCGNELYDAAESVSKTFSVRPKYVEQITLDKTSARGVVGETIQLTATVFPADATHTTVSWSSDNSLVASVSENGLVSLLSSGTATIMAMAADGSGVSASCVITVNQYAQSISLSYTSINDVIGKTYQLTATVLPENATNKAVVWSSDTPTVASVSETGLVYLNSAGSATITATVNDGRGVKATCEVTVSKLSQSIEWYQALSYGTVGDQFQLKASATSGLKVEYSVDNPQIAQIIYIDGSVPTLECLSVGKVTITASQAGNEKYLPAEPCSLIMDVSGRKAEYIILNNVYGSGEVSGSIGETIQFEATVYPENATNKAVVWSSNAPTVASVSETGLVSLNSVGTATITATAADGGGASASCKVIVNEIYPTQIVLNTASISGSVGESIQLTATVLPENTPYKDVYWSSSDPKIASVSDNGLVTFLSPGYAHITVSSTVCDVMAPCLATVTKGSQTIEWSQEFDNIIIGDKIELLATASSGLAVSYKSSDVAVAQIIEENGKFFVNCLAVGEVTITASQAGDDKYNAAESVVKTLTVNPKLVNLITLDKYSTKGYVGETIQLTATVSPDDATNKEIIWSSDNKLIADVLQTGLVSLIAKGNVNITATAADGSGVTATCKIMIEEVYPSGITLNMTSVNGQIGETFQLIATVSPENTPYKEVRWSSDNPEIASISEKGLLTLLAPGFTKILVSNKDYPGPIAVCEVTVSKIKQTIEWTQELGMGLVGDQLPLIARATSGLNVEYSVDNPSVAKVVYLADMPYIECLAVGEVSITASQAGNEKYLAAESVIKTLTIKPKLVSEITLDKTNAEGFVGETIQLTATVSPDDATNPAVVWTSDNEAIATVSESGLVTLIAEGIANITATAADGSGVSAICEVTVKEELGVESVTVDACVRVENGEIVVSGITDDAIVKVYNINSQLVYAGTDRRIALTAHNVYFVKVENKVYKVTL